MASSQSRRTPACRTSRLRTEARHRVLEATAFQTAVLTQFPGQRAVEDMQADAESRILAEKVGEIDSVRDRSEITSKSSGIIGRCARRIMNVAPSMMRPTAWSPFSSTVRRSTALMSKVVPHGVRMMPPGWVCLTQV